MKPMRLWNDHPLDVLDEIDLDPLNVRLGYPTNTPQDEIIYDLFKNENALELVESIAQVGLLEHEVPIVLKRDGQMIVVEGNRRVAALKAIQNPLLVPEFKARIQAIVSGIDDRASLRTIRVKEAPSQDDADQLIAALHTGKPRRPWTAPRRAEFFQAKVDEGKTLAELEREYPTIEVRGYVRTAQLMRLFRSATISEPALVDFLAKRTFPVSIFARLYDNEKFLDLARITVDPETLVATAAPPHDRFSALIEKIVADIRTKRISTRNLNKYDSKPYGIYFDELVDLATTFVDDDPRDESTDVDDQPHTPDVDDQPRTPDVDDQPHTPDIDDQPHTPIVDDRPDTPDVKNSESPFEEQVPDSAREEAGDRKSENIGDVTDTNSPQSRQESGTNSVSGEKKPESLASSEGDVAAAKETDPPPPLKKRSRKQSSYLNTSQIEVPSSYPAAMHETFEELKNINIQRFPNATMDMLRTVLEKTIKAYAESKNDSIKKWFGRNNLPVPRYEQLKDCLTYLKADLESNGDTKLVQVVQRITSSKPEAWTVSASQLNAMNHNHHISATPDDVEQMWKQMESLIRHMLGS